MTQTQVKQKLKDLNIQFLTETDLDKLNSLKEQIINLYSSIPFSESDSIGKELELKLLNDTINLYIKNNLDNSIKYRLIGDFDRILITLSWSLLPE